MHSHLTRRQVLHSAAFGALSTLLPHGLFGFEPPLRAILPNRILILLELVGGNDGLNMVVPYADSTYQGLRPNLKLNPVTVLDPTTNYVPDTVAKATQCIPFDIWTGSAATLPGTQAGFGVHAKFDLLTAAWRAGDLAFVHGVGYSQPNLSHFRGIDIWLNATDDTQPLSSTGWLGRMLTAETVPSAMANSAGVLFSGADHNPLKSPTISSLAMATPQAFIDRSTVTKLPAPTAPQLTAASGNPALLHVLKAQGAAAAAHGDFATAVGTPQTFATVFPKNNLGDQVKYVAQCIAGNLPCACYKIAIGGFDNHQSQAAKHADLLGQVADALRTLREALIEKGKWDNVLIMSFSEFGRRPQENGSGGTDHGTAAPHFFMGGKVKGGVYGTQPSLAALTTGGNLVMNTDFRQLYATCGKWLGVSDTNIESALSATTYTPIDCVTWT